jgi:hypothetical protein
MNTKSKHKLNKKTDPGDAPAAPARGDAPAAPARGDAPAAPKAKAKARAAVYGPHGCSKCRHRMYGCAQCQSWAANGKHGYSFGRDRVVLKPALRRPAAAGR